MFFKAEIVFVRIFIPFLLGIFLAFAYPTVQLKSIGLLVLLVLFGGLLLALIFYKKLNLYRYKTHLSVAIFGLFFCFSYWHTLYVTDYLNRDYFVPYKASYLKLVIDNEPQQKGNIVRFEAHVKALKTAQGIQTSSGKILIALQLDSVKPLSLAYGDELWIKANHTPVAPPYNPAEFNFKNYLANKNIYHQAFIYQKNIKKTGENKGNPIFSYAYQLRKKQINIYKKIIKNEEAFAVASTLVLGYRSDLSAETLEAYSKTGTIHALSVSGMHVGIIYLILNFILSFCNRNPTYRILKFLLIAAFIWYYSLITGLAPPILRSAIMLTTVMVAQMLKRKPNNYNILSATAFFILAYNPFLIWDVGFQLSFLAVFGLVYLQPKIYNWLYIKNKIGDKIWKTTAISLAAQTTTFPLSVYYFHQFPVYFILANLFIFLPIAFLMYVGLAILIFKFYFLAPIFEYTIVQTNTVLKQIAHLPYASFSGIWINFGQFMLLNLASFLIIFALVNYRNKLLLAGLFVLVIYLSSTLMEFAEAKKQQKIIAYSLRKDYATAFIDGNKALILSNLSTSDKNYQFYIQPSLDKMQIRQVKLLSWHNNFKENDFVKENHQILFKHTHILLLDTSFNYKKLKNIHSFNIVQIHGNPKIRLINVFNTLKTKKIWIDASNKDYKIQGYKNELKTLNLDARILKNNEAQIISIKNKSWKKNW